MVSATKPKSKWDRINQAALEPTPETRVRSAVAWCGCNSRLVDHPPDVIAAKGDGYWLVQFCNVTMRNRMMNYTRDRGSEKP